MVLTLLGGDFCRERSGGVLLGMHLPLGEGEVGGESAPNSALTAAALESAALRGLDFDEFSERVDACNILCPSDVCLVGARVSELTLCGTPGFWEPLPLCAVANDDRGDANAGGGTLGVPEIISDEGGSTLGT